MKDVGQVVLYNEFALFIKYKSSRRNGIISRFDLSHHRTCRPAYGGSLIT